MATVPVKTVEELSKEERAAISGAIALKMQSVLRAAKGEVNPSIAEIRKSEYDILAALAVRFR